MCTAAMQKNLPDFLTQGFGEGAMNKDGPRPIRDSADVPLGDSTTDVKTESILRRRERIKQAQENPGSHIPTGIRSRKDIMNEIT